jgi:hypothetical protein
MPYIVREDGEHFVIPSYRDVLVVKQKSQLKKEISLLSHSYGEYITLKKKNASQYEVAFSPDTGYLLGESIWHYFKKPLDLIYCEAIPDTTEAILVIVKSGSVYLDGSFPLDSISEELIIFLTQQNNFEIHIYGDVPISQAPEEGKFSFDATAVKSFTILDKPVFQTLPLLKAYQLQLVDPVLKSQGVGVFPTKQILIIVLAIALAWLGYQYFTTREVTPVVVQEVNPYQAYFDALRSPAPQAELAGFMQALQQIQEIPGWKVNEVQYANGNIEANVLSNGGMVRSLLAWAENMKTRVVMKKTGIVLARPVLLDNRKPVINIYPLNEIIATIVDRLVAVYPGNHMELGDFIQKGKFTTVPVKVTFNSISPMLLALFGEQLIGLPLVMHDIAITVEENGNLTGSFTMDALGN